MTDHSAAYMKAAGMVADEVILAREKYGLLASTHEALGVLWEEVHELVESVRSGTAEDVAREASQVSAVALLLASQCLDGEDVAFRERSGL
jgi:NTP pyrophosphatase (non-canonical NTP hydrolase)